MGQSTEELTTQIAGTRETLAQDLDALQDRVSPAAIVERRKAAARGKVTSVKDKVMGGSRGVVGSAGSTGTDAKEAAGDAIEGSPLAAGLIAFGAGLVIAALIPATEAEQRASQKVVDAAQPLVEEAKSVGQDIGDNLKESATDAAQQVKETAQGSAQRVQNEGKSSAETVKSQAPGQS